MTAVTAWRTWLMAAAVAGLVGWWAAPLPDALPSLVKPRHDGWRLPPLPRRVDQTALAAGVNGAGFWGSVVAQDQAATTFEDRRWRIAAVFGAGTDRSVLVQFAEPSKPPLRVRVGDTLPSGHRIVSVGDRDVCVQIGRKTYRLGVERSAS